MNSLKALICLCAVAAEAVAAPSLDDGRWNPNLLDGRAGKYERPSDEGKYVHVPNPYIHINNPYDGGYGPYSHQDDPYKGEATVNRYKLVVTPPKDIPYYRDGYYKNNGIKIIKQKHNYNQDKYHFLFETENKIRQEEKAVLKNANTKNEGIASSGFYEYIGPDGFMYRVDYTADEKGFLPRLKRLETPYSGKWEYVKV